MLLRAWRHRDACRDPEHPWPWLRQILHNEALRQRGSQTTGEPLGTTADPWVGDGALNDLLDRLSLAAMVASLPGTDRALLTLHYELDLSVASLARVLDVSESAVKVRLHRARGKLRSSLERGDALT